MNINRQKNHNAYFIGPIYMECYVIYTGFMLYFDGVI